MTAFDLVHWEVTAEGDIQLRENPLSLNYPTPIQVEDGVVYGYENQYVGEFQGGASPLPPSLGITTDDLQVTFTITGSEIGETITNWIYVALAGTDTWEPIGVRTGDGTVIATMAQGHYWAIVQSSYAGESFYSYSVPLRFFVYVGEVYIIHSPAQIFQKLLRNFGWVSDPSAGEDWPCFISSLPDTSVVRNDSAVFDTTGIKDGRLATGKNIFHYGVQFRIRSTVHSEGWLKASEIAQSLSEQGWLTVALGGREYTITNVLQSGQILPMGSGEDPRRRFEFSSNYVLSIKDQ